MTKHVRRNDFRRNGIRRNDHFPYIPILLREVEQEQRPSGNGDREAIVVGAGFCDGEGERAYTGYAPHIIQNVSANVFSLRRFGIFFLKRPESTGNKTCGIRPKSSKEKRPKGKRPKSQK